MEKYMPVIKLSDGVLDSKIPASGKCIIDYYAEWCGPCKMLSPVLDKIGNGDVTVIKVDVDKYPKLANKAGVTSIPVIQIFKEGELTETLRGAQPEHVILRKL